MVTMPYNFYIQVVFIKEDRLSIRHAVPEILDFKERDGAGSGRVGSGREYFFPLKIFPLNTKELAPLARNQISQSVHCCLSLVDLTPDLPLPVCRCQPVGVSLMAINAARYRMDPDLTCDMTCGRLHVTA